MPNKNDTQINTFLKHQSSNSVLSTQDKQNVPDWRKGHKMLWVNSIL